MDTDFANSIEQREARFQRRILEAQWFGGDVQFGKSGDPSGYVKTFQGMKSIPREVAMKWQDGEPVNGDVAVAEAVIGEHTLEFIVEPEIADGEKMRKRLAKDYKALAEKWATWKWHTHRGTPVNDRGGLMLEPNHQGPVFVWEQKRGPGRPKAE